LPRFLFWHGSTPAGASTKESDMNDLLKTLAAVAAGAAAMYYLDPQAGARRRAQVRDKAVALSHDAGDRAQAKGKRVADRVKGLLMRARRPFAASAELGDDAQLHERIRARLGHVVSHPKAIELSVADGAVCLSGNVLVHDVGRLLSTVSAMPGVRSVDNRLSVHEDAGKVPELQGKGRVRRADGSLRRPALSMLAVAAPLALMLGAAGRRAWRGRAHTTHALGR